MPKASGRLSPRKGALLGLRRRDRRCVTLADLSRGLRVGRKSADGQQHEQIPVALVPGSRTAAFPSTHHKPAGLVVEPPFPVPAALDHHNMHHVRQTRTMPANYVKRVVLKQFETVSAGETKPPARCVAGTKHECGENYAPPGSTTTVRWLLTLTGE